MNIREYNSIEALQSLRDDWQRLLNKTPQATFFQSLDWLEVYWRHYGSGQRLRVIAIEERGKISGILPLVVRSERIKIGRLRFVTYPLDYWGSFYSPIGQDSSCIWALALNYLRTSQRDWDVLEPRWIGVRDDECAQMEDVFRRAGLHPIATTFDSTAVIEFSGTWSEYLAGRTAKWRNNYRRWQKRLAELGEATYVRYRPAAGRDCDPRWDLYSQCLALAQTSWQGSSQNGTTLTHASVANFLRDVHQIAAQSGGLDLSLLYLNGQPIAFAYCYVFCGHVVGLRIGYDPAMKTIGAGNLLYTRLIEDSFHRGDVRFDMGPGTLEAKRQLWTNVLPIYRLTCCRALSLRQQAIRLRRRMEARKQRSTPAIG
jgi:CelD/BcsL family acetyltransferase involved in cellulose biosynthesis